MNLTATKTIVD